MRVKDDGTDRIYDNSGLYILVRHKNLVGTCWLAQEDHEEQTIVEMDGRISSMRDLSLDLISLICPPLHLQNRSYYGSERSDQGIACSSILDEESLETLRR